MTDHESRDALKLASAEYGQVVAPALAAAAEVAAERGDPHLYNDMASMLALMWMVTGLSEHYRQSVPQAQWQSPEQALEAAPLGACALVFTESELDEASVDDCLSALPRASRLLEADSVQETGRDDLSAAWQALSAGDHEQAIERLQGCARAMAEAVDRWESTR